ATSCCRLSAPHHRRETPVCLRPSTRGKVSWPSPAAVEATTRMTYEVSGSAMTASGGSSSAAAAAAYAFRPQEIPQLVHAVGKRHLES
ncbi:MAG: hypothetical protein ACXVGO_09480, partial [Mycobacterium sp.]